jgi:hypothetical protein
VAEQKEQRPNPAEFRVVDPDYGHRSPHVFLIFSSTGFAAARAAAY